MKKVHEAKRVRIDGQPERRAKIVPLTPQPDIRDVLKAVFLPAEKRKKNENSKKEKKDNDKNGKDFDTDEPKD